MSKSETTIVAEARACLTQIGIGVISGRRQPNRHASISGPANARSRSCSPSHRPPPSGGPPRQPRCRNTGPPTSSGPSSATSRQRFTAAAPSRRRAADAGRRLPGQSTSLPPGFVRSWKAGADQRQSLVERMARPGRQSCDTIPFRRKLGIPASRHAAVPCAMFEGGRREGVHGWTFSRPRSPLRSFQRVKHSQSR
jgi:hypothetical protein